MLGSITTNPAFSASKSGGALAGPSSYETEADKAAALPGAIERFGISAQTYVEVDNLAKTRIFEDLFWSTIDSPLYTTANDLSINDIAKTGLKKATEAIGRSFQESINGVPVTHMSLVDSSRISDYVKNIVSQNTQNDRYQYLINSIYEYLKKKKADNTDQLTDPGISSESLTELVSEITQLQESQYRLNAKLEELGKKQNTSNNKSAELGQKISDAVTISAQYAQGAALAVSISNKLGDDKLVKAAAFAQRSLTIASKVMQAYAGNPMAGLSVLNGLLAKGTSPPPDAALKYLENIASDIDELAIQIENNHIEVMTRLDHLQFLNENQLKGIATLLSDNIESCKNSIPTDFRVTEQGVFKDFVDIGKSLHYTSYEDIFSAHQSGRLSWDDCLSGLERFFNQSIDVDPVFTLLFSVNHFDDKQDTNYLKQQLDFYEHSKLAYQNLDDIKLLAFPRQYVLEWGNSSHQESVSELAALTTDLFEFNPLDTRYSLLDPILVHKYVGYLLAVYPFYDFLDSNNKPRAFDTLESIQVSPALIRSLRKALGIVNLSLAQQSIISGIGLSNHANAGVADLDEFENRWLKPLRHGKLQTNEYQRWTKNIYRSIIGNFARKDSFNLAKMNLAVQKKIPFALEEALEQSLDLANGTIDVEYNNGAGKFVLKGTEYGTRYGMDIYAAEDLPVDQYLSYEFSPAMPNLLRLQTLLADALLGYLGDDQYISRRREALLATSGHN